MNSLRARSRRARCLCISLKVRASCPSSSEEIGIVPPKSPSATCGAWRRRRSRREAAPAAQNPASEADQRDRPRDQDLAANQATLSSTSARESTATHSVRPAASIGTDEVPTGFATVSTPEVTWPSAAAASADR